MNDRITRLAIGVLLAIGVFASASLPAAAQSQGVCDAIVALKAGDNADAWALLNTQPASLEPNAAFLRAKMLEYALGVPHDAQTAIAEMTDAANRGVVEAQARLGLWYEIGTVGETAIARAYDQSKYWVGIAANNGHADSMKNYAIHLEGGLVGPGEATGTPDLDAAITWYTMGAKRGSIAALRNLGRVMLQVGNQRAALILLHQAARINDGLAHWLLATYYDAIPDTNTLADNAVHVAAYYHYSMAERLIDDPSYKQQAQTLRAAIGINDAVVEQVMPFQHNRLHKPVYLIERANKPWDAIAEAEGCN